MRIHPTAIIHPKAELADDVVVEAFTIIEDDVQIGPGCVIGPHSVIGRGTTMGRNNVCYSSAQIGVVPQDLKHLSTVHGLTRIGDNNVFREFVTLSSSTVYSASDRDKVTQLGSGCLLMACTHVAHDCFVGDGVIMANNSALAGHVTVQDRVILGGLTGVHQFCVLGAMSFIGGMSRINKDVLPYMLVEGIPPRCHGPNAVGLARNGLSKDAIAAIRMMYRILYRSDLNTTQALERIEAVVEATPERAALLEFVRASKRGITK